MFKGRILSYPELDLKADFTLHQPCELNSPNLNSLSGARAYTLSMMDLLLP